MVILSFQRPCSSIQFSAIITLKILVAHVINFTRHSYFSLYLIIFNFFKANKKLKLENGGLVRENLRLKAEVDNRSPQKYVFCS